MFLACLFFRVPLEIKVWPSKRDIGVKAEIFIWQQSGIGTYHMYLDLINFAVISQYHDSVARVLNKEPLY